MARKYNLPPDPILGRQDTGHLNLQLIAMCYLLRRLAVSLLHGVDCLVADAGFRCAQGTAWCATRRSTLYTRLSNHTFARTSSARTSITASTSVPVLKFVVSLRHMTRDSLPVLQYEVESNTEVVDLLVSLTYVSCFEGQLVQGLPIGMGLRCPRPANGIKGTAVPQLYGLSGQPTVPDPAASLPTPMPTPGSDGMVDFDSLPVDYQRAAIVQLLDQLPAVRLLHVSCS